MVVQIQLAIYQIKGNIKANNKIIYRGTADNLYTRGLSAKLDTPELQIIGTKVPTGLQILNNEVLNDVGNIVIKSGGVKTGLVIGSVNGNTDDGNKVEVNVKNVYLYNDTTKEDARVEVYNGSTFTADKIIADGKTKVQLNYDSSATLNNIEVKDNGNFSLQTLGITNPNDLKDTTNTIATFNLNNITVGDGAEFKTSIYQNKDGSISCSAANIKSDNLTINLGKNAKADFGGVGTYLGEGNAKNKTDWRGDLINFDVDKLTINVNGTDEYKYGIEDYKADYNYGVYIHVNDKYNPLVQNGCDEITVVGASSNNTGNLANDLQR